jgi:4-diphosphocytidyl-2-C-methyl-D-erythritol kinase
VQQPIRHQAPAKLNLGLRVLGRRPDGYHLLQSLVVFLDLCDQIEVAPALTWRLQMSGRFAGDVGEDNLVLRAGRLLADKATEDMAGCAPLAAEIRLEKNIPVAAGLGGGSSDAAAVLRSLNVVWKLFWNFDQVQQVAAPLGADLAVCLAVAPAMVGGIGELIELIEVPSLSLVIANPGIPLATKDVFTRLRPPYQEALPVPAAMHDQVSVVAFAGALGNGLTTPAIELCPTISALLSDIRALEGCRLAQMSGSGATCFGVFDDEAAAHAAATTLQAARPAWFVRACRSFESAENY